LIVMALLPSRKREAKTSAAEAREAKTPVS